MNQTVLTYLLYLAITIPLTVWVASALHQNGQIFLHDVFHGNDPLAAAVNRLLVIGFYLLNLGYVAYFLRASRVADSVALIETLSRKVGGVALIVGTVHLANVWLFNTFRKRAVREAAGIAPLRPDAFVAMPVPAMPAPAMPAPAMPAPAMPAPGTRPAPPAPPAMR